MNADSIRQTAIFISIYSLATRPAGQGETADPTSLTFWMQFGLAALLLVVYYWDQRAAAMRREQYEREREAAAIARSREREDAQAKEVHEREKRLLDLLERQMAKDDERTALIRDLTQAVRDLGEHQQAMGGTMAQQNSVLADVARRVERALGADVPEK